MGEIKHIFESPKADDADATLVRPSDWNSVHNYTMQDAISAGTQVAASGTVIFADSNGVTFGLSGSSQLTATVSTNYVTGAGNTSKYGHAWELTGNTAGTTSSLQGSKWYLEGGNSLTVSGNSNTIKFSVGNYITTARGSTDAVGLNTAQTNVTWTVNSSGISLNAGGYAGTTTAATSATLTLDSGGLRVSIGPYITTADLSANSSKYAQAWELTGNTAGTTSSLQGTKWYLDGGNSITVSGNSNTIKFSVGNYLTTAALSGDTTKYGQAWELTGNTAGTTSSAQGTKWYFDGGNSITVSGNSNTIKFSVGNYITTARASTDAIGLNTAKTNVTWTVNSSGLSLDAGGYAGTGTSATNATITMNTNGLAISVAAPGAAAEANWMHLLGAQTAGNTTASGSTIGLSGVGAITLSGANDSQVKFSVPQTSSLVGTSGLSVSTNGSTISVYPSPASYFSWGFPLAASTSLTLGGSSLFLEPVVIQWPVSASYVRFPVSQGFGSTSQTSGGAGGSATLNVSHTYYMLLFTQNVGASSRSLNTYLSTTQTSCMQIQQSQAASNQQTISHFFTYPVTGNSSVGFTTGYNPSNVSIQISTTHLTAFTGARFLDIPFATILTPGNYWLGLQMSSATASTSNGRNYTNITAATMRNSFYAESQVSANINEMGGNTTAGSNMWGGLGHGWWTTDTNGRTTASINLAQVSTIANQPIVPFVVVRQA
jgi:hypothetical protein